MNDLLLQYSYLLFFSIEALKELFELRHVKDALFQWNKEIHKEKNSLMKSYNELVKTINSLYYINDNLMKEKELNKVFISVFQEENKELKKTNREKEINSQIYHEKYDNLKNEWIKEKILYKKQIFNLQYDLEVVVKERDDLLKIITSLNKFLES